MAYANINKLEKAKLSLANLESILNEKDLSVVFLPFNAPLTGANIAKHILMGTIAEKEKRINQAIQYYKLAVATEDSMVYNEPRDWLTPARHYLGNALLHAKKYKEAGKVYSEDLKAHPKNYISTKGLKSARVMTIGLAIK
jgi:tetratricopeptide (TPR) repeat protein